MAKTTMRLKSRIDWNNPKNCDRLVFAVLHLTKNLSAKEMAKKSGLSETYIYKLRYGPAFGGPRHPRMLTMRLMLKAAGLTLTDAENEADRLGLLLDKVAAVPAEIAPKGPRKRLSRPSSMKPAFERIKVKDKSKKQPIPVTVRTYIQ